MLLLPMGFPTSVSANHIFHKQKEEKKKLVLVIPDIPPFWNEILGCGLKKRLHLKKQHKRDFGWLLKLSVSDLNKKGIKIPCFNTPFRIKIHCIVPNSNYDTSNIVDKHIIDMMNQASKSCICPLYPDDKVINNPEVIKTAEVRKGIKQTIITIEEI